MCHPTGGSRMNVSSRTFRKVALAVIICCCLFFWVHVTSRTSDVTQTVAGSGGRLAHMYDVISSGRSPDCEDWINATGASCDIIERNNLTLAELSRLIESLMSSKNTHCRNLYDVYSRIYHISVERAKMNLYPENFKRKMSQWLNNSEDLLRQAASQEVITVRNKLTEQQIVFNPLRNKRPSATQGAETRDPVKHTDKDINCDFCNYTSNMATDEFDRVDLERAFTVANAFKLASLHGMAAIRRHEPLHWSHDDFRALVDAARLWFKKAFVQNPHNVFPHILWDLGPLAGASQAHPHIHLIPSPGYHGEFDKWSTLVQAYQRSHNSCYWGDMRHIHTSLGLAVTLGDAQAMAPLTPKKDGEFIIISQKDGRSFYDLIFHVIKAYVENLNYRGFSAVIVLPPMNPSIPGLPALARIVPRGSSRTGVADVTSMELFAASNINVDPYSIIATLRKRLASIEKTPT